MANILYYVYILNYIISPFLFSFPSSHFPVLPGFFRFMAFVPLMAVNTFYFYFKTTITDRSMGLVHYDQQFWASATHSVTSHKDHSSLS